MELPTNAGLLLNTLRIDAASMAEFNRWHVQEHIPERLDVPGFSTCLRYLEVTRNPARRHLVAYETTQVADLASEEYLTRLNNPTRWTSEVLPLLKDVRRGTYEMVSDIGKGTGGAFVFLEVGPPSMSADPLIPQLEEVAEDIHNGMDSVVRVRIGKARYEVSRAKSATSEGRATQTGTDLGGAFGVLIDALHPDVDMTGVVERINEVTANANLDIRLTQSVWQLVLKISGS